MPAVDQSALSLASTFPTISPVITADELFPFTPPTPHITPPTRSTALKRKAVVIPPRPSVRLDVILSQPVPTEPAPASAGWAHSADALAPSADEWFLDSSLVEQMDTLIFAIFRRRLEHDAVAQHAQTSYTPSFGRLISPLSTVCSIYSGPCESWPRLIERVVAERGLGLFICKVAPDSGPKCFADGSMTWYQLLSSKAVLRFDIRGVLQTDIPDDGPPVHTATASVRVVSLLWPGWFPTEEMLQAEGEEIHLGSVRHRS